MVVKVGVGVEKCELKEGDQKGCGVKQSKQGRLGLKRELFL
jgi:hypothetical protein